MIWMLFFPFLLPEFNGIYESYGGLPLNSYS